MADAITSEWCSKMAEKEGNQPVSVGGNKQLADYILCKMFERMGRDEWMRQIRENG